MTKYRKKSLIEAEQWTGSKVMADKYHIQFGAAGDMRIPTLEGDMTLDFGDYIATGVRGEHWAIEESIFKETYGEVQDGCGCCRAQTPLNRTPNSDFVITISKLDPGNPQLEISMDEDGYFADCPVNFCPKCGRKLREDNE
ncbi:hypothetical protein LFYK43_10880 [Ligilactobacillus salitolerans]|uniref:Prophage protein n=1 Tax=Ligilactobacillus salitolerans TaxID=1808352 RepID=A0A401ISY0_9LACO|nr:hypothetical protein LFYK43_10880 [Ligilactobacillus salitolerans]